MGKNVFRSGEVQLKQHKVFLRPPDPVMPRGAARPVQLEPVDVVEEYSGPTADQLRREAEAFREQWESEKEEMIAAARSEAERITSEAEDQAFRQIREKTEEATNTRKEAEEAAEEIRAEAEQERDRIIAEGGGTRPGNRAGGVAAR
jgi:flagellar assembly protein FliH